MSWTRGGVSLSLAGIRGKMSTGDYVWDYINIVPWCSSRCPSIDHLLIEMERYKKEIERSKSDGIQMNHIFNTLLVLSMDKPRENNHSFYPRPILALGTVLACVCMALCVCVCLSVCVSPKPKRVRAITHHVCKLDRPKDAKQLAEGHCCF